jgi:uncharacterized OB-fold protein
MTEPASRDAPPPAPTHSIAEYRRGYESEQRLRGFRSACGFVTATWGLVCPQCGQRDLGDGVLSPRGRVAAYSVQTVPTEEFVNDAPYAYVIVELDGGGRITGWMPLVQSPDQLAIGDRVRWRPTYRSGVVFERDTDGPETATAAP